MQPVFTEENEERKWFRLQLQQKYSTYTCEKEEDNTPTINWWETLVLPRVSLNVRSSLSYMNIMMFLLHIAFKI